MSSKTLSLLMRVATISVAICGLFVCGYLFPSWINDIALANPEFSDWSLPWKIFLSAASVPLFIILVYIWKETGSIKHDEVFTTKTAKWVKTGAVLLFADVGFFFVGNLIFGLTGINHPGIFLLSLIVDIVAIALATLMAILSRYLTKAADLQELSEGTI